MSNERDDYWDLEKLVPRRKNVSAPFASKPVVREITVPGEGNTCIEDRTINAGESGEKNTVTYIRDEDSLIKRVSITRFVDKYDFYGNFRKAALIYYDMKAAKCDFEPFFSYMPQYSQLNSQQKNYYLYWRDELRHGRYIKSDYSYIYLYAYEILNLPDKIPPQEGIKKLIEVWRSYRPEYPNIDQQLSLWVQDYCLLYNLPIPTEMMSDFLFEAITASSFKEFYLSKLEYLTRDGTEALIMYLSYYDWHRGKYAGGDSKEMYKKHLLGAMYLFFREIWESGKFKPESSRTTVLARPSFRGSLCTHAVKSMLEIEYYPIIHDEALRSLVTEALRYTENQLRALLGIKSRLAIRALGDEYRKVIDYYFASLFEKLKAERKIAERPEYEKLYESTDVKISLSSADEIEMLSWENTEKLVVDDTDCLSDGNALAEPVIAENVVNLREDIEDINISETDNYGLSVNDVNFIKFLINDNYFEAENACRESNELIDAVVDRINSAFADNFGDVIIELFDDKVSIIDDYREDVNEWLMKQVK